MIKNLEDISFPVYATQGGGYAREIKGTFIFIETPVDFPEMIVGSSVPEEWGLEPANQLAREQCSEDRTSAYVRQQYCSGF